MMDLKLEIIENDTAAAGLNKHTAGRCDLREVVDVPSSPQAEMVHPLPNERYIVVVLFFRIGTSN